MVVILAFAPSAFANDTYVDQGDGADASNDCSDPATPCRTITKGIAQAGSGDTIFVGGGETYTASLTLDGGKSLVQKDFSTIPSIDTSGEATLDSGAPTDVTITGLFSTVKGFAISAVSTGIDAQGSAVTISHNHVDSSSGATGVLVNASSNGGKVVHNQFTNSDLTQNSFGVYISSETNGFTEIKDNAISGWWNGIIMFQGRADISKNTISEPHNYGGSPSAGIDLQSIASATIEDNTIDDAAAVGPADGIQVAGVASAAVYRTLISHASHAGIQLLDTRTTIRLDDDAITGVPASGYGLIMSDNGANGRGIADVTATNTTIQGKGTAVMNRKAVLTLSSSLIDAGAIQASGSGARCHITYSRGPSQHSGGTGCKDFQRTADPKLKSDGYHLRASSPMIDKGQSHKPPQGAEDIDGQKRALPGDCSKGHHKARRDIGADEFKCP
jgi:hypothetical protein